MSQNDDGHADNLPERVRKVVAQAEATIKTYRRMLEERGVTPDSCLEELRRTGGEAAVEKVRREADETFRALNEKIEREIMHMPAASRPPSRHLVRRGGGV